MNGMTISNGWVYCTWAVIAYEVDCVIARITPLSSCLSLFSTFFVAPEQSDDCDGCVTLSFGKPNLLDVRLRDHVHIPEIFCYSNCSVSPLLNE